MDSFPLLPEGISDGCGVVSHLGIMRALISMEFIPDKADIQGSFPPHSFIPLWKIQGNVGCPGSPVQGKQGHHPNPNCMIPQDLGSGFGKAIPKVDKLHPAPGAALEHRE